MTTSLETVISPDGLSYKKKPAGSPFSSSTPLMSCIKCGRHRPKNQLSACKLAGTRHFCCSDKAECDAVRKKD